MNAPAPSVNPAMSGNLIKKSSNSVVLSALERQALCFRLRKTQKHIVQISREMDEKGREKGEKGVSVRRLRTILSESGKNEPFPCYRSTLARIAAYLGLSVDQMLTMPHSSDFGHRDPLDALDVLLAELPVKSIVPFRGSKIPRRIPLDLLNRYQGSALREGATQQLYAEAKAAHRHGMAKEAYFGFFLAAQLCLFKEKNTGTIRCIDPELAMTFLTDSIMALRSVELRVSLDQILRLADHILNTRYPQPAWIRGRFNAEVAMYRYAQGELDALTFALRADKFFNAALQEHCTTARPAAVENMQLYNLRLVATIVGENTDKYHMTSPDRALKKGEDQMSSCCDRLRAQENWHGFAGAVVETAFVYLRHNKHGKARELLEHNKKHLIHGSKTTRVAADCINGYCEWNAGHFDEAEKFLVPAYSSLYNLRLSLPLRTGILPEKLTRPDLLLRPEHSAVRGRLLRSEQRLPETASKFKEVMGKSFAN